MQEQKDSEDGDGERDAAPADLAQTQFVAASRDRQERHVGRRRGIPVPRGAEAPRALGIDRRGAVEGQERQRAEEDQRTQVAVHHEMHRGPDGDAPEERVPRHALDAGGGLCRVERLLAADDRGTGRRESEHDEHERHQHDGQRQRAQPRELPPERHVRRLGVGRREPDHAGERCKREEPEVRLLAQPGRERVARARPGDADVDADEERRREDQRDHARSLAKVDAACTTPCRLRRRPNGPPSRWAASR